MAVAEKRLNFAEMRYLRCMCGVTQRYERIGWLSRAECVDVVKLMERMEEEDQLVKRIVGFDVGGVRLRGPQTGWMNGVKRALNERGMSVEHGKIIVKWGHTL